MDKANLLTADILDILFDGKNKLYGAYELRKYYNKRLIKSILSTFGLAVVVVLAIRVYELGAGKLMDVIDIEDITISAVKPTDLRLPKLPVVPKARAAAEQPQQRRLVPVIIKNLLADPAEQIGELLPGMQIGIRNTKGGDEAGAYFPIEETGTAALAGPLKAEKDTVFTRVHMEAAFPGGPQAWSRYLQKKLDPDKVARNGVAPGRYQVVIKFIVNKDGSIADAGAETNWGFGMEEEALKIISNGPRWIPAEQNGRNVKAYRRQPITFVIDEH
jgi:protein TonB